MIVYLNKNFLPIILLDSSHKFIQKFSIFLNRTKKEQTYNSETAEEIP